MHIKQNTRTVSNRGGCEAGLKFRVLSHRTGGQGNGGIISRQSDLFGQLISSWRAALTPAEMQQADYHINRKQTSEVDTPFPTHHLRIGHRPCFPNLC